MTQRALRLLFEALTLGFMLWAALRCPDCFPHSLVSLFDPPAPTLLLAGGLTLGARFLTGWVLDRLLPAYAAYVEQVHYPVMRERLRARGLPLALWIIFAGAVEELAYRGILLPAFGLLPTSLLFGLCHLAPVFQGERRQWPHALGAFLSALLYGSATLATGSLWPAVLAHAAGNGILSLQLLGQTRRMVALAPQEGAGSGPNSLS